MHIKRSYYWLRSEMLVTSAAISMPAMTPFFQSIGLSQSDVGFSQAIFITVTCLLNIPTGWIADRFSRKMCNLLGNAWTAAGFLAYPFATNFAQIVVVEIIVGVGFAFTSGADAGLMRAYCEGLERDYQREMAFISFWRPLLNIAWVIAGGAVAVTDPQIGIGLAAIPYFLGATCSLFTKEMGTHLLPSEGEGLRDRTKKAFGDMYRIITYALHGHKDLAWAIVAMAMSRRLSHPLSWIITPMLLVAGVPALLVGVGWAFYYASISIGAWLSRHLAPRLSRANQFILPALCSLGAMGLLSARLTIWTVGVYLVIGVADGWYSATMTPIVQALAPKDMQSTIVSLATSLGQFIYIGAVSIVNIAGNFGVQWALLTNALFFTPFVVIVGYKLSTR